MNLCRPGEFANVSHEHGTLGVVTEPACDACPHRLVRHYPTGIPSIDGDDMKSVNGS